MADVPTIILSLASSIVTASITTVFNRSKTKAEIAKIKAETDKILVEAENLKVQVSNNIPSTNFDALYYDGTTVSNFDFEIQKAKVYDNDIKADVGLSASGNFTIINDNMINIERINKDGRFILTLKTYTIENVTKEFIVKDPAISQQRKIQVSCEMKSLASKTHKVDFVLRDADSYVWLTKDTFEVSKMEWMPYIAYLRVSPDKDFYLKIYDYDVEFAPSSIQIRNLKVIEKF